MLKIGDNMPFAEIAGRGATPLPLSDFYDQNCSYEYDLTVFVPALNEEGAIFTVLKKLREAIIESGLKVELHVADDGSTDRTADEVRRFHATYPDLDILLICNQKPRGIAFNCFDSAALAKGRYHRLGWGDDVETVGTHLNIFSALDRADIIIPVHEVEGKSWFRRLLSATYRDVVYYASGYRITNINGGNCIRTSLVRRFNVDASGFGFQAELLTRLLDEGATAIEVPGVSIERQTGRSKALKLRNWFSVGWTVSKIMARRLRRVFDGRHATRAPGGR